MSATSALLDHELSHLALTSIMQFLNHFKAQPVDQKKAALKELIEVTNTVTNAIDEEQGLNHTIALLEIKAICRDYEQYTYHESSKVQ
ncbi:MAG: hypothetical protein CMK63_07250 [Pseudoalteromonadaceae bacterium]|nr:hypothetical protein [Gemmatimonadota bacterium]MBU76772.1 hypothetical protein [Pseudoalteromonadaceae bacterium]|tara:strand:- start:6671 stop:6934 length:264 start_codon:yes stop_codon:yes gene_type:complete